MTADERIEKLLNRFGQTISDLPKVEDHDWSRPAYDPEHLISAKKAALVFLMDEWQDADAVPEIRYEVEECLLDYICHLADVIDKLEIALETVLNLLGCDTCTKFFKQQECKDCSFGRGDENLYRLYDWYLGGINDD